MELSKHYSTVYENEYKKLPKWKQYAIKEDIKNHNETGITQDFIKEVINKAEIAFENNIEII